MTSRPVYDDGVLRITSTSHPPGLALQGEIDESTYPALVQALQAGTSGREEIHLSLGGVSYCDLAGLRAIVAATGVDFVSLGALTHSAGVLDFSLEVIA